MSAGRERLRAWIDRSKINQNQAAELLSMHKVMLSQILSGVRSPGLQTALTIEAVTGVPVESWARTRVSKAKPAAAVVAAKRQIAKR